LRLGKNQRSGLPEGTCLRDDALADPAQQIPRPVPVAHVDGTDHTSHKEQASMIRRYIIWRNNHPYDKRLRRVVTRANMA